MSAPRYAPTRGLSWPVPYPDQPTVGWLRYALGVQCPFCWADVGKACRTRTTRRHPGGRVAFYPHSDRIHLAQQQETQCPARPTP